MKIDRVITGSLEENCYILGIEDKVLIIDPGDDIDKINKVINNRKVLGVLIDSRRGEWRPACQQVDAFAKKC